MQEVNGIKVHKAANIMPMMNEQELQALQIDIKEHGLREPIWLFKENGEDYILDGRNRAIACSKIGVEPEYRYYDGEAKDLISFVISLNISRRHLNSGQRACLAVDILPMIEEQTQKELSQKISDIRTGKKNSDRGMKSSDKTGMMFGVSGMYVSNAKRIKEFSEEMFEQVKAGKLTLTKAIKEMKTIVEDSKLVSHPDTNIQELPSQNIEDSKLISCPEENYKEIVIENFEDSKLVSHPKPSQIVTPLTKTEQKKVAEYIEEFGTTEEKAIAYIVKKRKSTSISKPKTTSFQNRIEFKVNSDEKESLINIAKSKGISLSELLREVVKNIK